MTMLEAKPITILKAKLTRILKAESTIQKAELTIKPSQAALIGNSGNKAVAAAKRKQEAKCGNSKRDLANQATLKRELCEQEAATKIKTRVKKWKGYPKKKKKMK